MTLKLNCKCTKSSFQIENFPQENLGRLRCYCDDCQSYLHYLNRRDVLDEYGGTEIAPVYPKNFKILSGQENLECTRLAPKGIFRWSVKCCNTPICNTIPGMPWIGIYHILYNTNDSKFLSKTFGPVKSSIHGRFAQKPIPTIEKVSPKASWLDFVSIMPFILKGFLFKKNYPSVFFIGKTKKPIVRPYVLNLDERKKLLEPILQKSSKTI